MSDAPIDPRAEVPTPPPQPPTVEFASPPPWAIRMAEAQREGFVGVNARLTAQDQTLQTLADNDLKTTQQMAKFEVRLDNLEKLPSTPPLNSTGVKALIDGHPSQMDLSLQALQAAEIIKNQERDKRIEETHAISVANAETLKAQSDFMGMGKRGAQWLWSKEGRTAMAQFAAAIVTAYEILKHGGVLK